MNQIQRTLRAAFERHASRTAVQDESLTLTYAELSSVSNDLARALDARGVRPGQTVPLLVGRSIELVVAEVALLRLGAAYSPLDLASPAARQHAMLEIIQPTIAVVGAAAEAPMLDGRALPTFDLEHWWSRRHAEHGAPAPQLWLDAPAQSPVYVMFTSGSTGAPKGVMAPASGILRLVASGDHITFDADQRWGFVSSPAFDASTLEVWGALLNGGCCVVQQEKLPSLESVGAYLQRQEISDIFLTSALFNAMVEDQLPSFAGVAQVIAGGERVSPEHARRFLQAHPSARLINGYGPTEDTTFTLCHRVQHADTRSPAGLPIGRPLRGTEIRVVDQAGAPAADEGELWTSGAGTALGYLRDPARTAEKFVLHDGARWYRTGDLVRRNAAGTIEFIGRVDRQVKLRGHRVELEEVELALTRCAGIKDAAVLALGATAHTRRIVAAISTIAGTSIDVDAIDDELRRTLPDSSIPGDYKVLAALPRTLNGKLDRRALEALWSNANDETFSQRLQASIEANADRTAVEDSLESLSYAELSRRSEVLASRLLRAGLRAGDHLAIFLPRCTALVVAMVAAVRVGAVYASIDLASPPDRIGRIVQSLKPRFAIVDVKAPFGVTIECVRIDKRRFDGTARIEESIEWSADSLDAAFYVTFTSGSTGAPKGVVVPSRGLMRLLVDAEWAAFPKNARWLFATSPAFDISNLEVWGALLNGACCIVQESALPSLDEIAQLLVHKRITHAQMSSALFNSMVDTQLASMHALEQFIVGGERASPPHMRRFLLAHPEVRLVNAYGPSETTVWSTSHTVTLRDTHEAAGIPIGTPIDGTLLHVDATGLAEIGELLIGGAGVAIGYLDDDEQTRSKFIERDGSRWYRSGDLATRRADGVFEFHGRADRQVKLQGQRIEIDEVELALAACPGVGEVAVLLRGHDAMSRHLAACYSGLGGAAPARDEVSAHLAARLPAAAVPAQMLEMARLPRTLSGKIDRDALAHLLDEPRSELPTSPADAQGESTVQFRGKFEQSLAVIWRELLPPQPITRDSHFMRSGGTSLLALHVAANVRKRLHRDLSPVDVLRNLVLSAQASVIARLEPLANHEPLESSLPGVQVPLTNNQQNILAASRLDPTGSAYLVHVALTFPIAPDWAAMRTAFETLALRHPALRLMARHDGMRGHACLQPLLAPGWLQGRGLIESAPTDLVWPEPLLRSVNRPLDTSSRGSMRVDAWDIVGGGALVVWTMHHFVVDEAGIDTALAELDGSMRGHEPAPVYGSPFAFKAIESAWKDSSDIPAWASRFAAAWDHAPLPLQRPPAAGRELAFAVPPTTRKALLRRCGLLGLTPFPLMLTAYGLALQDVFGPRFRFVLTPFSRRTLPELMEPISYLCDTVMVEAGSRDNESPSDTLTRVNTEALSAQQPRFHSMHDLAAAVAEIDSIASSGLWQFGFTWRLDPSRPLRIGSRRATLIRVPQMGARHSMCLHAARIGDAIGYSIEAVDGAFATGQVAAVARAFDARLSELCAPDDQPARKPLPTGDSSQQRPMIATSETAALRDVWARRLGMSANAVGPANHFLRDGGSSLEAMRMASDLRRECGFQLDIGAFLANPTFAQLATLQAERTPKAAEGCVMVGPQDFSKVLLLIPGALGHAAGLFALAEAIQSRMASGGAVAILDLDAALQSAPVDEPLWFVARRIVQLVTDIGPARVSGIVGFSLGGLLALNAATGLGAAAQTPVWMLDSFAPRVWGEGLLRRIERKLAHAVLGAPRGDAADFRPHHVMPTADYELRATADQWSLLGAQLVLGQVASPTTRVNLIQARVSPMRAGLIWQRRNNGFEPARFASWRVHRIDGEHMDLPRQLAASTAQIILGH